METYNLNDAENESPEQQEEPESLLVMLNNLQEVLNTTGSISEIRKIVEKMQKELNRLRTVAKWMQEKSIKDSFELEDLRQRRREEIEHIAGQQGIYL